MALVDIIKGALEAGMRYYSGYLANNDVVRVTGYLVKKSELEKLDKKKQSVILMLITALLWSLAGVFIKVIDWEPLAIVCTRSLVASVVMCFFVVKIF